MSDWLILVSFKQNTNNQLFCNVKNMERERGRGLFGVESNATLPADWKHHEAGKEPGLSLLLPVSNCPFFTNFHLQPFHHLVLI